MLVPGPEQLRMAQREVSVMRSLQHPNIIPLLASSVEDTNDPGSPSKQVICMLFPLYMVSCCALQLLHDPFNRFMFDSVGRLCAAWISLRCGDKASRQYVDLQRSAEHLHAGMGPILNKYLQHGCVPSCTDTFGGCRSAEQCKQCTSQSRHSHTATLRSAVLKTHFADLIPTL